ncbi:MAG: methyltransferase type 11 [Candidatus Rokuibacteriota bacterium]|nr:MAG: methyltransferase type 11 [Candidatus Rokubacteria bacterium]
MSSHDDTIREQFTKQAIPFSNAPGIKDEDALRLLVEFAGAGPQDVVLDVACGPGLVVCAFAQVARHVTGIDLTPAMIERARELRRQKGLTNVTLEVGDVLSLPYPDASFSIVTARFAFHHLPDPRAVLAEMKRVCAPAGNVVVIDVMASPDPEKAAAFNRMERLRDPSHVRALALTELTRLFSQTGLGDPRTTFYGLRSEMEALLRRSFPEPGNAAKIRRILRDSLADDALGIGTHPQGDEIHFVYPVAILMARR